MSEELEVWEAWAKWLDRHNYFNSSKIVRKYIKKREYIKKTYGEK